MKGLDLINRLFKKEVLPQPGGYALIKAGPFAGRLALIEPHLSESLVENGFIKCGFIQVSRDGKAIDRHALTRNFELIAMPLDGDPLPMPHYIYDNMIEDYVPYDENIHPPCVMLPNRRQLQALESEMNAAINDAQAKKDSDALRRILGLSDVEPV